MAKPEALENCVEHRTISTADPVPRMFPPKDGSVISGVTDPASLEGHIASEKQLSPESAHEQLEVPEQVILPEEGGDNDSDEAEDDFPADALASPVDQTPIVLAAGPLETRSTSDLPDDPPLMGPRKNVRSASDAASAPAKAPPEEEEGVIDDYIRSPEVQNAIVERSPGSRYVRFMEKLGSGASKDVYRAYDTQEGIEVAWNVVNLSGVPKNERNRIVNEVRLLERLHHHNIISFHGSWVNRERQEVNFVTEILSSGTLKSFINKVQVIRWKIAKRWALQILQGLEYLHSQDPPVIHRDLKCDNIFINGTSGDLRIGDLGLSTVHRNGRVLSVLGTPEFMAPDMYEENSYDEKVDIYAFGMCLLEIFTKEIPYSECSNPAQIYKKVSNGEPPEVLSRLQSKHAREFVLLCLGYRDEEGRYIRPSCAELLKHPFLLKRANDDDEVVVDPPLRERPIIEGGESSASPVNTPVSKRKVVPSDSGLAAEHDSSHPRPPRRLASTSTDEEDGDRFDEMPESETNMRKVKVLMGRDTELQEDEEGERKSVSNGTSSHTADSGSDRGSLGEAPVQQHLSDPSQQALPESQQQAPTPTYLVAAAVLENESLTVRPYADDNLKLVVTLPVEGQTQNVQFDFHLVEDDPVQVAKEMVVELGIPQEAVLEISETISGLACAARMKQDKYAVRMQNAQKQSQSQAQSIQQQHQHVQAGAAPPATPLDSISAASPAADYAQPRMQNQVQHATQQQSQPNGQHGGPVVQQGSMQMPSASPVPDYSQSNVLSQASQQQQHGGPVQAVAQQGGMQMSSASSVPDYSQTNALSQGSRPAGSAAQTTVRQDAMQMSTASPVPDYSQANALPHASQQHDPTDQRLGQQVGQQPVYLPAQGAYTAVPAPPPSGDLSQQLQPQGSTTQVSHAPLRRKQQQPPHAPPPIPKQQHHGHSLAVGQGAPAPVQDGLQSDSSHRLQPPPQAQSMVIAQASGRQSPLVAPLGQTSINQRPEENTVGETPRQELAGRLPETTATAGRAATGHSRSHSSIADSALNSQHFASVGSISFMDSKTISHVDSRSSMSSSSPATNDIDSDDDEVVDEELRKLEEDYQKNLQRAQKVFDNRMDNLQRSQIEREAQHQKTLEKHQKERLEFEKRLAQEAEQQHKRIEQLQKEWDKRRETLAHHKKRHVPQPEDTHTNGVHSVTETGLTAHLTGSVPTAPLHTRSTSNASSTKSQSPTGSEQGQDGGFVER